MSIKLIPEILDEVVAAKTREEVKKILLSNQSPAFMEMLKYVYYPKIQFAITELPAYKPDPGERGLSYNSLFSEMRRMYIFTEKYHIVDSRRKQQLILLCESVHPSEAELVGKILKRDLGIPVLTYEFVSEVFPGLLPD